MSAFSRILIIAVNEFRRVVGNPLVLIISLVLMVFVLLNGPGSSPILASLQGIAYNGGDVFFMGLNQSFYVTGLFCSAIAVFLGAMSMAEERSKRSLGVLLAKPLYRRDVVAGKFLGMNAFLLLFIAFNVLLASILVAACYQPPADMGDFALRIIAYVLMIFFECSLVVGLMMLVGIMLKDTLKTSLVAITFLFGEWYYPIIDTSQLTLIDPVRLLSAIVNTNNQLNWANTSMSFTTWLNGVAPYFILIILEVFVVFIIDCFAFTRSDEI